MYSNVSGSVNVHSALPSGTDFDQGGGNPADCGKQNRLIDVFVPLLEQRWVDIASEPCQGTGRRVNYRRTLTASYVDHGHHSESKRGLHGKAELAAYGVSTPLQKLMSLDQISLPNQVHQIRAADRHLRVQFVRALFAPRISCNISTATEDRHRYL